MLESLQAEVGTEHKKLHERIHELEHRLASKETLSDQKQVKNDDMIKRLEGVAAKQQKMLNQSDRKIAKLELKLKASREV